MKIKELNSEKEEKIDLLEWNLRMEKISVKYWGLDEYFQKMKLDEIKEGSKSDR